MSGAASRRKGHSYERLCARELRDAGAGTQRRSMAEYRDGLVGDVDDFGPFGPPQCKVGKRPSVWGMMDEAKQCCADGQIPVGFIRRTSSSRQVEDYAVIPREDFVEWVAQMYELGIW